MLALLAISAVIGLLVAITASLIALRIQRPRLDTTQAQQDAWERAQEARQEQWRLRNEKRIAAFARDLTQQVQQLEAQWQEWESKDAARSESLRREYHEALASLRQEQQLASLPRADDIPLPLTDQQTSTVPRVTYWKPLHMPGADLAGRDLSYRYLSRSHLSEAQLSRANLFMADLSHACLSKAEFEEANLTAVNLTNADCSGANFRGANFLVADMKGTVLTGADLRHARNLTLDQLYSAVFDHTTLLDPAFEVTLPRVVSAPESGKR